MSQQTYRKWTQIGGVETWFNCSYFFSRCLHWNDIKVTLCVVCVSARVSVSPPLRLLPCTCPCVDFWLWYVLCRLNRRNCLMNGCLSCVTIDSIGRMRSPRTLTRSPSTIHSTLPPTLLAWLRAPQSERWLCPLLGEKQMPSVCVAHALIVIGVTSGHLCCCSACLYEGSPRCLLQPPSL